MLKADNGTRGDDRTWFLPVVTTFVSLVALDLNCYMSWVDYHVVAYFCSLPEDEGAFSKFIQVGRRVKYRKCDGGTDKSE